MVAAFPKKHGVGDNIDIHAAASWEGKTVVRVGGVLYVLTVRSGYRLWKVPDNLLSGFAGSSRLSHRKRCWWVETRQQVPYDVEITCAAFAFTEASAMFESKSLYSPPQKRRQSEDLYVTDELTIIRPRPMHAIIPPPSSIYPSVPIHPYLNPAPARRL